MKIPGKSALLVIDLQDGDYKDGLDDGIPIMEGSTTYQNAPKIIKFFREHDIPVIQIKEAHRADGVDFGRVGWYGRCALSGRDKSSRL